MSAQLTEAPPRVAFDQRVLRELGRGCEAAPEIAESLRASVVEVSAALERLSRADRVDRAPTPTFRASRRFSHDHYRYRVRKPA